MNSDPVIVVGAGAAGIATAIASARRGRRTVLVERRGTIGGTVANALVHTLGGLYDGRGGDANEGLPVELARRLLQATSLASKRRIGRVWTLAVAPLDYRHVVEAWIEQQEQLELRTGAVVEKVCLEQTRIAQLHIRSDAGVTRVPARAVVDTTGSCDVVRQIDPSLVTDAHQAAWGLVLAVRGVADECLQFPRRLGLLRGLRSEAKARGFPQPLSTAWLDLGVEPGEAYIKLAVSPDGDPSDDQVRASMSARANQLESALSDLLHQIPEWAGATVTQRGEYGIRDGGRVKGEYVLTKDDVLSGRRFDDAACRADWPIERWDPVHGVQLQALDGDSYYEIPVRSLKVQRIENLWTAGKTLSADHWAQASARVVGYCWAMGEAVARSIV